MSESLKDHLDTLQQPIYPTLDSLDEAMELSNQSLPEVSRDRVVKAIHIYANALLKHIKDKL